MARRKRKGSSIPLIVLCFLSIVTTIWLYAESKRLAYYTSIIVGRTKIGNAEFPSNNLSEKQRLEIVDKAMEEYGAAGGDPNRVGLIKELDRVGFLLKRDRRQLYELRHTMGAASDNVQEWSVEAQEFAPVTEDGKIHLENNSAVYTDRDPAGRPLGKVRMFDRRLIEIRRFILMADGEAPENIRDERPPEFTMKSAIIRLTDMIRVLGENAENRRNLIKDEATKLTASKDEIASVIQRHFEVVQNKNQEFKGQSTDLIAERDKLNKSVEELQLQIFGVEREIRDARVDFEREYKTTQREIETLQEIHKIRTQKKEHVSYAQVDGYVTHADMATGMCFIDLSFKDRVRPGMVFEIYRTIENVTPVARGRLVIQKVYDWGSRCHITWLRDKYDPILKGFVIDNKLYSKTERKNIVVAGDGFAEYSKREVEKFVTDFNHKVQDAILPDTDILIVGRNTPKEVLEKADRYSIQKMSEREFLNLIGRAP